MQLAHRDEFCKYPTPHNVDPNVVLQPTHRSCDGTSHGSGDELSSSADQYPGWDLPIQNAPECKMETMQATSKDRGLINLGHACYTDMDIGPH